MRTLARSIAVVSLGGALACGADAPAPATPAPPPPAASAAPPAPSTAPPGPAHAFDYPVVPRGDVVDDYHGVKVPDPYRALESLDAPATRAFIDAENHLTDAVLGGLPVRDELHARLTELSSIARVDLPTHRGAHWFWTERDVGVPQRILLTAPSPDAKPRVLVDPNALSPDGRLAYVGMSPSERGHLIAYGLAPGGGDWQSWHLREVETGKDRPDVLEGIKYYAPRITPDEKGIYYSRFPAPQPGKELSETDHDCKVVFHAIGTPSSADVVVYERPDQPTWQFDPWLSPDGRWLVLTMGDGEVGDRGQEQIVAIDLARKGAKPVALVDHFGHEFIPVGLRGSTVYFLTTEGKDGAATAVRKRVVARDLLHLDRGWIEIVPEGPDAIEGVSLAGPRLFVMTLKDAHTVVSAFELSGKRVHELTLPGVGSVGVASGRPEDTAAYYAFTSFTTPLTIARVDLATWTSQPWRAPALPFAPADFETRQVFYASRDGTKVPMFVTSKKGLVADGLRPTLLTGYGGFGRAMTPWFDPTMVAWMERGGVYALANIRGGGEYGDDWHRSATRVHKQRSFDDFIAGALWLESSGLTSPAHLGIVGRSGGGALVATVEMERPELFGAVAPLAGVLDLVRFPLFGQGAGWEDDWGSPDVPAELAALLAYSPLHNVRAGTRYPATYLVTADHDARVAPLHSYKLAAALQAAQAGPAPILLRVETQSGHGGGTTVMSKVDQATEELAFFWQQLAPAK